MKKTTENRYPHSANLFRFCKEALSVRYDGHLKVIDQDVGAILAFDPADCSHWKKGKKNVKSLLNIKAIASHLNIDDRLLIDITSGKIDAQEALFEYKHFNEAVQGSERLEEMKKDFFKDPSRWQISTDRTFNSFEEFLRFNQTYIISSVDKILELGHFEEAPIYLPEIYKLFQELKLEHLETKESERNDIESDDSIKLKKQEENYLITNVFSKEEMKRVITYKGIMKPYIRFLLAKELFVSLVQSHHPICSKIEIDNQGVMELASNFFALRLLVPSQILKKEMMNIRHDFDPIEQLADIFWVSKSMMNKRVSEYFQFG